MALLRDVVIGLDASTSACKAIAWDANGRQLAVGRAALELITPGPDLYEQSAEAWWQAACQAVRAVTQNVPAERLAGLAIAHQRESFVLVNDQAVPLHNAILWMDERSKPYLPALSEQLGAEEFHRRTGKPLFGNLAIGKLAWLRDHQPHLLAQANHILDTHAFLVYRLTGSWVTSSASADPLGLYDLQKGDWDPTGLHLLGLDINLLPPAKSPGDLIGKVSQSASLLTALPVGLPVFAGLGDGQAAAFGCGITQPGHASLSLGTSVITGTFSAGYTTHSAFRTMTGGLPGSYILETVLLGGVYTLGWFTNQFLGGHFDPADLEAKAAGLPPGSQGLQLVPYWNSAMGPYWDASASGIVVGWKGIHRPEHFYRAILEGIGYELRLELDQVSRALDVPITLLIASGGGSRSNVWLQILADQLGIPIQRSTTLEAASLGAAILAAAGAGLHANISAAAAAMHQPDSDRFLPDLAAHKIYSDLYMNSYLSLFPALRQSLHHLADNSSQAG